jgi:hypothetical protein
MAYLLRLWREKGGATTRWRASLEDPHSGEKLGFAHLDELVAFLRERTGLAPPAESLVKHQRTPKTGAASEEGDQNEFKDSLSAVLDDGSSLDGCVRRGAAHSDRGSTNGAACHPDGHAPWGGGHERWNHCHV